MNGCLNLLGYYAYIKLILVTCVADPWIYFRILKICNYMLGSRNTHLVWHLFLCIKNIHYCGCFHF